MDRINGQCAWMLIAILGVLTGFDALAIDMYLPALTHIADDLGVEASQVQASLSVFLLGLALGQFLLGPIADRFGRKTPLLGGVVLFLGASLLIAVSDSLGTFMVGRFAQGLGGAAGIVVPRMIVTELFDRRQSARIFALLMQVMMIAPIAAPPVGGVLLDVAGWHSIFFVLAGLAALTLFASVRLVPETLAVAARRPLRLGDSLRRYGALLRDPFFTLSAGAGALITASLFVYIGASAFIFIEHFGMSPQGYSVIFAVTSLGLVAAAQVNNMLLDRVGEEALLTFGLFGHVVSLVALAVVVGLGLATPWSVGILLFAAISALSFAMGNITAIALDRAAGEGGTAASLFGVAQYAAAGLIGVLAASVQGERLIAPVIAMLFCALTALVAWNIARNRVARPVAHTAQ